MCLFVCLFVICKITVSVIILCLCFIFGAVDAQQGGAEAACWAHNPKVGGSRPSPVIGI